MSDDYGKAKMTEEIKKRLKELPRAKCSVCGKSRTYLNPMEVCFECKKKFCYDHIFGAQINLKMGKNEKGRNICEECQIKFDYQSL